MKKIIKGSIVNFVPAFRYTIEQGSIFLSSKGKLPITVDTGFSDYFALPKHILKKLNLEYKAYETFILANGQPIEVKTYRGEVKVNHKIFKTLFIEGDYLVGMRFLAQIGTKLVVDFPKNKIELLGKR